MEVEILSFLGNWFWGLINPIIWLIFIQGPLQLLNAFDEIFRYINGSIILDVIFGIPIDGGSHQFNPTKLTPVFWAFFGFGLVLAALLFMLNYIGIVFSEEMDFKQRIVKSVKSAGLGILFTFLIPVGIFMTMGVVQIFIMAFSKLFTGSSGGGFAKMIYKLGDPNWDGSSVGDVPSDFGKPGNIGSYNIVVTLFLTWGMLYTVAMVGIATIQKTFEIFFQMLIGPIIAATMTQDDGVRMKSWKDSTLNKMLVLLATTLCYYLFLMIVTLLVQRTPFTGIPKMLFMALVVLGGGVFIQVAPQAVGLYLGNESVSAAEGRSALASAKAATSTLTAGAAGVAGAAVGNKWLNQKMKKKSNLNQAMMGGSGAKTQGADAATEKTRMGGFFGLGKKGLVKTAAGIGVGIGGLAAIKSLPKRASSSIKGKVSSFKKNVSDAWSNTKTTAKSKFASGYGNTRRLNEEHGKEMTTYLSEVKDVNDKTLSFQNNKGETINISDVKLNGHQQNTIDYHTAKHKTLQAKKDKLQEKTPSSGATTRKEKKIENRIGKIEKRQSHQLKKIKQHFEKSYNYSSKKTAKEQSKQVKKDNRYSKQQARYSNKNKSN